MMVTTVKKLYFFLLKLKLKKKYQLKLGKNVIINKQSTFEGRNFLSNYSSLISSHIGFASYIGERTTMRKVKIGKYTSIGPDVNCIFGKHPSNTFVSTHPAFFSLRKQSGFTFVKSQLFNEFEEPIDIEKKFQIAIGNDVWIGANVSIMDGVRIGNGAIVASCALVIKDVPPYAIVGGVPAKVIKYRFSEKYIAFLERFKWWNNGHDWIQANAGKFNNIETFTNYFKE